MQHTQISCSKRGTEVASHKAGGAKEVNMKSRLCHHSAKKGYDGEYEAVSMTTESNMNDMVTKKKRK